MPVLDHPVHEKTRVGADFKYRCNNRRHFASGYYAPERVYGFDGLFTVELRWIPHRMSTECRYDLPATDPGCTGCKHANPAYVQALMQSGCSSASVTAASDGQ